MICHRHNSTGLGNMSSEDMSSQSEVSVGTSVSWPAVVHRIISVVGLWVMVAGPAAEQLLFLCFPPNLVTGAVPHLPSLSALLHY